MAKVLLFTGVETYKWKLVDFQEACNFAKAHRIDGLIVKIYEVTQGEWNTTNGGPTPQQISDLVVSNRLLFYPYGFFYGTLYTTEVAAVAKYAKQFGVFILNLEGDFDSNNKIDHFVNMLTMPSFVGNIWVSTWANPVDHGWISNITKLDDVVTVWQPEEYNDDLIQRRLAQFPTVKGNIYPTYSVGDESLSLIAKTEMPSLWEYQTARSNPIWVDKFVTLIKGKEVIEMTDWFDYPWGIRFGTGDVAMGGAHDATIKAPPNHPVTCIQPGTVCDLSSPDWGEQVGLKLDSPYNGHAYMVYLHLSAINPALKMGQHVNAGNLIGWVGGANNQAQYSGTSNPTGQNKLNTTVMSSMVQVGIAVMDGPEYGSGAGWKTFPPIDWTLNPERIITTARSMSPPAMEVSDATLLAMWTDITPVADYNTGIANQWKTDVKALKWRGSPLKIEGKIDWKGNPSTPFHNFQGGFYTYERNPATQKGQAYWHPYG